MGHVIHKLIKPGCMFLYITSKSNIQNLMFDIFTSAFKISRNISRFKNFCRLHGFALHYEPVESGQNLRILYIISMQKVVLPIVRVETDFVKCKFCQKLNQFSQVIQELIKAALFLLHWESYIYDVHKK